MTRATSARDRVASRGLVHLVACDFASRANHAVASSGTSSTVVTVVTGWLVGRVEQRRGRLGDVAAVVSCHSSWAPIRTQAESRRRASVFGKIPTTSVRRLPSWLSRSSGLVDQICANGLGGTGERGQVSFGLAQHFGDSGVAGLPGCRRPGRAGCGRRRGAQGEDRADPDGDHVGIALGGLWSARCA